MPGSCDRSGSTCPVDVEELDVFEKRPGGFANRRFDIRVQDVFVDDDGDVSIGRREARGCLDGQQRLARLQ